MLEKYMSQDRLGFVVMINKHKFFFYNSKGLFLANTTYPLWGIIPCVLTPGPWLMELQLSQALPFAVTEGKRKQKIAH